VLSEILRPERDWWRLLDGQLHSLYCSRNVIGDQINVDEM
jgi:hypothetical protein